MQVVVTVIPFVIISTLLYVLLKLVYLAKGFDKKLLPASPTKVLPLPRRVTKAKIVKIDVEYVRVRSMELGVWVDYRKLLSYLSKDASKLNVVFYSTTHPQVEKFNCSMKQKGYHVVEQRVFLDEETGRRANTNIDALLVDGLINESPPSRFGKVVIISGDHKFVEAARLLTLRNQKILFVAFQSNTSSQIQKIAKVNSSISYLPLESIPGVVTQLKRHDKESA